MYKGRKISLVLPAYNEEKAIKKTIEDFSKLNVVDEIIVVDNNSTDQTAKIAKLTKRARVVTEKRQGYGYALRKGYSVAKYEIIAACDVDGTYIAKDIFSHLKKINQYDFVFGTRVHKNTSWIRSYHMNKIRRLANRSISSVMTALFLGPYLTDLGCTFRVFNKSAYKKLQGEFHVGTGYFQPEFTILALLHNFKVTQVPVHYRSRIGESKLSGSFSSGFKLAMKMMLLILEYRIKSWFGKLPSYSNDQP